MVSKQQWHSEAQAEEEAKEIWNLWIVADLFQHPCTYECYTGFQSIQGVYWALFVIQETIFSPIDFKLWNIQLELIISTVTATAALPFTSSFSVAGVFLLGRHILPPFYIHPHMICGFRIHTDGIGHLKETLIIFDCRTLNGRGVMQ